jgi:hypothetical protein
LQLMQPPGRARMRGPLTPSAPPLTPLRKLLVPA